MTAVPDHFRSSNHYRAAIHWGDSRQVAAFLAPEVLPTLLFWWCGLFFHAFPPSVSACVSSASAQFSGLSLHLNAFFTWVHIFQGSHRQTPPAKIVSQQPAASRSVGVNWNCSSVSTSCDSTLPFHSEETSLWIMGSCEQTIPRHQQHVRKKADSNIDTSSPANSTMIGGGCCRSPTSGVGNREISPRPTWEDPG